MAWLTDTPVLHLQSVTSNSSYEDRSGQYRVSAELVVSWGCRLTTTETTTTKEADGYAQATAEAWQRDAPARSITYGSVDVSSSGIGLALRIVAREQVTTRSISRSNDAGGYRLTETTTVTTTTGVNLNAG